MSCSIMCLVLHDSFHSSFPKPWTLNPKPLVHQVVRDDQEGMSAILDWLSYVPKDPGFGFWGLGFRV